MMDSRKRPVDHDRLDLPGTGVRATALLAH